MTKIAAFGVLFLAMSSVGLVNSKSKSGADSEDCDGHKGVFKCIHVDPNEKCKGTASYIEGVQHQNNLTNMKPTTGTLSCTTVNQGSEDCVGYAVIGEDCE
jgi:hypothetical protein